ncbi:hypothetical protein MJD09_15790, partial [bacterium]|nr:hypothetical protein [bacterium]
VEGRSDNEDPGKLHNNFAESLVFTIPPDEGCGLFYLDSNVYRPSTSVPLGINFELNSSRSVRLDLYDVSAYHVTMLTESSYITGENRFEWDGETLDGQKVGSGVYVITLRSGNLVCWKKVIIVR